MIQEKDKIIFLTMKLDLKTREYNKLCEKLESLKKQDKANDEELLDLRDKFQNNHDEIVEINKQLKELKEKTSNVEYNNINYKNELFKKNVKNIESQKKDKELIYKEKNKNILIKLIEKIKKILKIK